MLGWRHRVALWLGSRLLARTLRVQGADPGEIVARADVLRKTMRG